MEEKNIYGLSAEDVQKLKMTPPVDAWTALEARLDEKQVAISKPFLRSYFGFALLLTALITYTSLAPVKIIYASENSGTLKSPVIDNHVSAIAEISQNKSADNTIAKSRIAENSKHAAAPLSMPGSGSVGSTTMPQSSKTVKEKELEASTVHARKAATQLINDLAEKRPVEETNVNILSAENRQADKNLNSTNVIDEKKSSSPPAANTIANKAVEEADVVVKEQPADTGKKSLPANDKSATSQINDKKIRRLSIAAFYSPNHTRSHLKDNHSMPAETATEFYDHEKYDYSYSAGLMLGYDLNKHWTLSAGGIYSTLAYTSNLNVIYAGYNANNDLRYRYPTSCGTIDIPVTVKTPQQKGDSMSLKNSCSEVVGFITVPLTVKYRVEMNRLTIYMYSGLSVNFMVQSRARLNEGATAETTIINNVEGAKKMNYGYLFGAGVQYNFYNGIGIFIEPAYRGSINSVTENISVYCYPYSFGLNTGIFFHF